MTTIIITDVTDAIPVNKSMLVLDTIRRQQTIQVIVNNVITLCRWYSTGG